MIKKFLFVVLLFALFFRFTGNSTLASPAYTTDQACTIENASDAIGIDVTEKKTYQIFSPTKDNLRSIQVALATPNNNFAKAKVKLIRLMDVVGRPDGTLLAEKFTSIQGEAFVKVEFDNLGISEGVYAIAVEAVHQNEKVYWVATTGTCYPGGYAMIGDEVRTDLDFFFVTTANIPISIREPVANTSTNPNPSTSTPAANQSSGSTIGTPPDTQTTSDSNKVEPSSDAKGTIQNVPSGAQKIEDLSTVENKEPVDKTEMNQKSAYQDQLMADKELQEQIAEILKDLDINRYKGGAFGLSGRIGRILTWPVFYGICGLFLLLIIAKIIHSVKRKKIVDTNVSAEV